MVYCLNTFWAIVVISVGPQGWWEGERERESEGERERERDGGREKGGHIER